MSHGKTIIFLADGMADEPVPELGDRTPLQQARTPAMDAIAREGICGTLRTLPDGLPTGSEVANMSILGCRFPDEYGGRGPLEAAGRSIPLKPDDIAFRLNLTATRDGILTDFSGGHVAQADSEALIAVLEHRFGGETIHFHPGVSYRNLLVLSGPEFSDKVKTEKPDDHQGDRVADHLPLADAEEADRTVAFLRGLMEQAPAVLEAAEVNARLSRAGKTAANGVWPWSGGRAGAIRTLADKYGITGAVISAVDVINGLGRCLGMDVIRVPGATGYVDTNYEGKADAAVAAIRDHDLVYLHVEAIDEVSHEQHLEEKVRTIEAFDSRVVARVMAAVGPEVNLAVLPDHPVPVRLGRHTRVPVPVAIRMTGRAPDAVTTFDEASCPAGALGAMEGDALMALLFGRPRGAGRD